MPFYKAPVTDYRFLLSEVFDAQALTAYPGYEEAALDLLLAALEEAGKFCEEVLAPLNQPGDLQGCRWNAGVVSTPDGFPDAHRQFAEAGWLGLSCETEHGGQGLPLTLRFAVDEMVYGANLSFAMYPGLSLGVYEGLHVHGTDELKAQYLPKLASGAWTGTMCLTEAHAGTDLSIIRTSASPLDNGTFVVNGTKIFISAGEHDLAENIVHLVLARLPDAPSGTRGISMFLVPKFIPQADGTLGKRNGVHCGSIEHKMGIKGSATCVLNFDEATGWLVGEPHKGLRAMFTLMNAARLGVGLQGLGLSQASYVNAVAYARERRQGRALSGVKEPQAVADRLVHHAEIRRGLLSMRAFIEGARALATWTAMRIDDELKHPDPAQRAAAADLVALMTPVIKGFFTDGAFAATNVGLQTLGGHGYIREFGMEQFVRDARIGQIYEGTNYVQAMDLVGRKLPEEGGRLFTRYVAIVEDEIRLAQTDDALTPLVSSFREAVGRLQRATLHLAKSALKSADEAGAGASDLLSLFGYVAVGHMWLRQARIARERLQSGGVCSPMFYEAKVKTAQYYMQRMLPQTEALLRSLTAGADTVMSFPEDAF
ncbi:MAG: acyl-CoA dehydrogenase C-terminal domain-containing protein [Gemmatimonadaceae bacterium]